MTELSQRARSIIEEARRADSPTVADKQRIREKLISRLGAGALVSGAVIGSSASAASGAGAASSTSASGGFGAVTGLAGTSTVGLTTKITLVSAIVGAVGAGAVMAPWDGITRSSTEKTDSKADRSEQTTPHAETNPAAEPHQSATGEFTEKTRENTLSRSYNDEMRQPIRANEANTNNGTPHLEAELSLLRSAQVALRKGDSARALSVLNKHRSQFPRGSLRQEREAARAVALCELGRYDQGRRVAKRLLIKSPRSPLAQRIARSCNR